MIAAIIRASVRARNLVLAAALVLAAIGVAAVRSTPGDALPDLSDVQVIVRTSWPGQAPQIVENQVTYPVASTMLSGSTKTVVPERDASWTMPRTWPRASARTGSTKRPLRTV